MSDIKLKLYNFLVNKHSGIRESYHRLHDNADRAGKIKSYAALLGLNAQYYLMGKRDFGTSADVKYYEDKPLFSLSESAAHMKNAGSSVLSGSYQLQDYDIISFDVFDTLLLRPFSEPTDIFFFLGEKLGIMDFKRIRIQQEFLARKEHEKKYGDNEVTFAEIWERMEREVGIPANEGMKAELEAEERFCFANPFMLELFNALKEMGKTIIAVSDMYLPSDFVGRLLEKNGFTGIEKIYMSCEYGKSKSVGDLYGVVKDTYAKALRIVHIGDNEYSDVKKAKEAGLSAYIYPNVNAAGKPARAYDMSPLIGGAYRGVVNARLYTGLKKYPSEYEYGYIYGGILVLGYCSFIREYCRTHGVDKILFLSRDGDIIKQAYDFLYPGENTEYMYISRSVVTKLMRKRNRYDFLLRFADKLINQGLSIADVLGKMGLESLIKLFGKKAGIRPEDVLTDKNLDVFKAMLIKNYKLVDKALAGFDEAAKAYYTSCLAGVKKAAVVDIGWAGSAAVSLSVLAKTDWGLETEIIGLVAGTNTLHNSEPDAAEEFLQSGRLVPYVFSQSLNRDIMKKHDPNKGYNVFWELLFSSPTRQLAGFQVASTENDDTGLSVKPAAVSSDAYVAQEKAHDAGSQYIKSIKAGDKLINLLFGKPDANIKGIKRIQKGILDFVHDYHSHFKDYPYMMNISGRDAAAPMLLAASHDERYLKAIAKRFDFKIDV